MPKQVKHIPSFKMLTSQMGHCYEKEGVDVLLKQVINLRIHMQKIQPLFEMENSHNINALPPNCLQMVPFDDPTRSPSDILARRLKNRERQRRYRARKRQEADLKKACAVHMDPTSLSSSHSQVKTQVNYAIDFSQVKNQVNSSIDFSNDSVSRIHCRRNWKKDARRAHMFKEQVSPISNSIPTNGSQPHPLTFGVNSPSQLPVILDKKEEHSITPSRRNWKAEARNKKD